MTVLIDTCVLIDMIDRNQPRSDRAIELLTLLSYNKTNIELLAHSMFEVTAVIKNLHNNGERAKLHPEFKLDVYKLITIDEEFIGNYLNPTLPYIKGADFMFLCYAFKEGISLITEDKKLLKKSREANVNTFNIDEYLDKYGHQES